MGSGGIERTLTSGYHSIRGALIHFQLLTLIRQDCLFDESVTFVLTPGGQTGEDAAESLRDRFETVVTESTRSEVTRYKTIHLLTWDRRNTGQSSFCYSNSTTPVLVDEVEDLHELVVNILQLPNIYLYGFSSGARVSLRFAVDHPQAVQGVIACPPTGGLASAQLVARMYYTRYERMTRIFWNADEHFHFICPPLPELLPRFGAIGTYPLS